MKLYYYDNFDINVNDVSFKLIIWGLYIGIVLGTLGSVIFRHYSGKIIKSLVRSSANSEETAKTLRELGLNKSPFVRGYLKDDSLIRRSVMICDDPYKSAEHGKIKKFWYEKFLRTPVPMSIDFNKAKFYLPEENRIAAELRFKEEKHPVRNFVLSAVILSAVALFAAFAIPELLQMLDNFISLINA